MLDADGGPPEIPVSSGGTALPSAAPHALGTIGDFEVVDKLGQGGMGAVYRARQITLGRLVALKILPAQFEEDEDFVSRFQREARLAASLNHPNLVRVYSSGVADGSHFIAMELVEGETLGRRVKRGALPLDEAVHICLDVARALQFGWQSAQLIHRDIKPSNIYLSHSGEVKLGDLGLAKSLLGNTTGLTHTGAAMGTPHYISPEQARGDKALDFRTDIYSLGCTLYQLLTGRTPYEGDPLTVMNLHLSGPPAAILKALPGCPIPLARLVGKMMKKQRHERHQSYEELIEQMESVITFLETGGVDSGAEARIAMWREIGGGPSAPPPSDPALTPGPPTLASPTTQKSKLPLYGGIAAAVAALGVGAFFFLPTGGERTATQLAVAQKTVEKTEVAKPSNVSIPPVKSSAAPVAKQTLELNPTGIAASGDARSIFDGKSLAGWRGYGKEALPASCRVVDGTITATPRSFIITREEFGDFDLRFDWKVGKDGNGGVFFHVPPGGSGELPQTSPEFQLSDQASESWKTGSLYGVVPALVNAGHPPGEWNTGRLLVRGSQVEHYVNDRLVCRYDSSSAEFRELRSHNKAASDPSFGLAKRGAIGLQFWNGEVFYRNISVRALDAARAAN